MEGMLGQRPPPPPLLNVNVEWSLGFGSISRNLPTPPLGNNEGGGKLGQRTPLR